MVASAPPEPPTPPVPAGVDVFLLALLASFFASVLGLHVLRLPRFGAARYWLWPLAGIPLLLVCVAFGTIEKRAPPVLSNLPAPWRDVPVRQYAAPAAATTA